MKKCLYLFRSILLIPVMYSIILMFDSLMTIGIIGKILYGASIVFILLGILGLVLKNHNINDSISYNIIFILVETFIVIIGALYNNISINGIYSQNIVHFKTIYIFFILLIIGVVINASSISLNEKQKKD